MGNGPIGRVLEIYVAPDCLGWETAHHLADVVRALAAPDLAVRVIDLSDAGAIRPASVFAVPTYVLDGRVISLGNPGEDWLLDRLGSQWTGRADPASGESGQ